ncbi:MAG: PAS domain-containing sensor histidine kinase [Candidatus Lokiarchaeota archaeon]|nr:PAS domain-containing sensor histidine kinase [Candidatus Lokiarchaeota archaeon]
MNLTKREDVISREKFQEIINNLDVGYFKGVLNGKLLIHNTVINKILRIDPSVDLTGTHSSQFFSDPNVQKSYYDELTKNGFVKDFIVKIRNPEGELLYIQLNSHLIKEDDQNNIFIEGTATNVTEKYILEQSLKETEKKFNLIANNTNDLIAILNKNFEHVFINENAYYSVLGYRKEEILGKRPRDFAHPDDIKRISKSMKRGLLQGELSEEYRTKHKNGLYKWIEVKEKFIKENNEIAGAILISRDITERKNALQKIKESENKYRTLFESSTDGIYSTDMEGLFIEVNEAFIKMLGYSRDDLLKMRNHQLTPKKWHEIEDNMLFTHLSAGESKVYEKEYIHKNGNILPVSIRFWILPDNHADPYRIWAIVRDITGIKQIEQKLKEVNRMKSEFLRRASHELKTPLISIKGYTDLILTLYSEELIPDIISKLEEIDKGCERLQYIINNLLSTSKLESPDLKPKLEKEDLSFLINYCVDELHPLAVKREHSFNIEIHDSIITRFEKEEIYAVISNLLMNAIKYTSPRGWIDIKTEIKDDFIIVSIKDNGIGFTEEEKEKIFKQFGKIERYGQGLDLGIDGTGLGLYISKKIVESHGGKIWMESKGKNKGSIFYFSLPLIKD